LETRASILQLQGRWDEALEIFKKAYTLSPRDASLPTALAEIYWMTRRYSQAIGLCDEASTLAPDDAWPYLYKVFIYWSWRGDTRSARSALENVSKEHAWAPWVWFWQEIYQGNHKASIERLDIGSEEWIRIKIHALPKSLLAALAYKLLDDTKRARAEYGQARILLEAEVQKYPDDPRYRSSLGIAYAALGQKEKAIEEGKKAVELLPISKDAMYGIPYVEDLAHIYAILGEKEAALEQLEFLLTIPSWYSVPWIELDPRWTKLRGHRKYKELMNKYRQSA
jgi:tetratricopeptide (TPR) repeat protein